MASSAGFDSAFSLLPRKPLQQFARKRIIYDPQRRSDNFYVVVSGRVKVSQTAGDGRQTVIRIAGPGGFFGETSILGARARTETAMALDVVKVMAWSVAEIEQHVIQEPQSGLALVQALVRQSLELEVRIQAMALCKTPERVSLALLQLAQSMGSRVENGAVRIPSLTHQTLAEYVGTSREIVTFHLNRLRRSGLVKYSRKHIDICWQPIAASLREHKIPVPALSEPRLNTAVG